MQSPKFTSSVNIIRDSTRKLNYISTPNATNIVNLIANDFRKGIRSFNIIGSYGTGKSSFLWALQQSFLGKENFFKVNFLPQQRVKFINIVGEFASITGHLADHFEINIKKDPIENIFLEILARYKSVNSKGEGLLIIMVDEFGKFLEYAAENAPERELYFIQQLAEFVNNPDNNIILITTVHQNFDAYAFSLNRNQKAEWTKVKGRFREIIFNEPIEQLLFLASEHLKVKSQGKKYETEIKSVTNLVKRAKVFPVNYSFDIDVSQKLYPLDLLSAYTLTLCLQRYGQNERSLFSFLESTDQSSIHKISSKDEAFYNLAHVYDYLIFNFYSYINSRYNPDFTTWSAIKNALEVVERTFHNQTTEYFQIVKTVGLLNITAAAGAEINLDFLKKYCSIALGINNPVELIENLDRTKIIAFRNYSTRYVLTEGTDLDIPSALIAAGNKVDDIVDIATLLNKNYQLPSLYAKEYFYKTGSPRLFEYKISEEPIDEIPKDEIDGFINLVFSERLKIEDVIAKSLSHGEAIIYAYYSNTRTIKTLLFELEKTRKVIDENTNDRIAVKELNQILLHQTLLLNHYIISNLYSKNSEVKWIYQGHSVKFGNKKLFTKFLTTICNEIYSKTPVFRNELINRHKISSQIYTARKSFFQALSDNWNQIDLGFDKEKFPPEKTIYLTLFKENGIKLFSDKVDHKVQVSKSSTFIHLWNYSVEFLESAKKSRRTIAEFTEPLTKRPFKVKQGLIDLWVASFFFIKRDDFALFGESGFIPYINDEVLDLIVKRPYDYQIKTFDIAGVKLDIFNSYRIFLDQDSKDKISNSTFIETIKPFLTFYKSLPDYSKNTKRLQKETLAIRNAISQAKDPEKAFFDDFPFALGYSIESLQKSKDELRNYTSKLQDSIRELRTSHDNLINRFEEFIQDEIIGANKEFVEYKTILQHRFKKLKKHLCLPHQKAFIVRLDSQLDDRNAWLNSLAQVLVGKATENMKDEEEMVLYDKFKIAITELDTLTSLLKNDIDESREDVFGIEMNSFSNGTQKKVIRYPKNKKREINSVEESIRTKLSGDHTIDLAALAMLLQDLIKK